MASVRGMIMTRPSKATQLREKFASDQEKKRKVDEDFLRPVTKVKSLFADVMHRCVSVYLWESGSDSSDDTEFSEVAGVAPEPGSLAAILGMRIDPTTKAAPIREKFHSAPLVQRHNGTTFLCPVPKKKSLFSAVMDRCGSVDDWESSSVSSDDTALSELAGVVP